MMDLDLEYVQKNPGTGVVLAPRSCSSREQLEAHAKKLRLLKSPVLFDPQFYNPRTERDNIINYPYWKDPTSFATKAFARDGAKELCKGVIDYQCETLDVESIILPGRYTNTATEEWREMQRIFADAASELKTGRPVFSTLALGPDVVGEPELLDRVLNEAVLFPVDGIYIVLAPPKKAFLVTDDGWLYNALDGLLSLASAGKTVIVGYANQQSLIFAASGVTGLASGNFRNVRSFDVEMFDLKESKRRGRGIWYYDAQSLCEFKIPQLTLAYRRGLKDKFGPRCEYCEKLLSAANPGLVPWPEPQPFKHFLTHLRQQWLAFDGVSVSQRGRDVIDLLVKADTHMQDLTDSGFVLGDRPFLDALVPSLSAVTAFIRDRAADIKALG